MHSAQIKLSFKFPLFVSIKILAYLDLKMKVHSIKALAG